MFLKNIKLIHEFDKNKLLPLQLNTKLCDYLYSSKGFNFLYTPKYFGVESYLNKLSHNFNILTKENDHSKNYYIYKNYYINNINLPSDELITRFINKTNIHTKYKIILEIEPNTLYLENYKNIINKLFILAENYPNNYSIICYINNYKFIESFLDINIGYNLIGDTKKEFKKSFMFTEDNYLIFLYRLVNILYNEKFIVYNNYYLLSYFNKQKIDFIKSIFSSRYELIYYIYEISKDVRLPQYSIFLLLNLYKNKKKMEKNTYNPWEEFKI